MDKVKRSRILCMSCEKQKPFVLIASDIKEGVMRKEIAVCRNCLKENIGEAKLKRIEMLKERVQLICPTHKERKKTYIRNKNGEWESYCLACEKEKWTKGLKRIKLNPLTIAKYFYEKNIEDIAVIQKLIYLTYLEVLKKEDIFIDFNEEWEAWLSGPVLETVFFDMKENWDEYGNFKNLFDGTLSLSEVNSLTADDKEKIAKHCEAWAEHYQELERRKKWYKLSEESKNQPWIIARNKVNDYLENERIKVSDIISFVQQERNSSKRQLEA